MHRIAIVALLAVVAAAPTASGVTPKSGLYGKVVRGPVTPVCRAETPCDAPAQVTLVFTRARVAPVRTRSSVKGLYRVPLAPGLYTVSTSLRGPGSRLAPLRVRVRRGHFDRVNFAIDTGIR